MIVAFSTSSPLASVALISPDGKVIAKGDRHAPMQASGAVLAILKELLASTGRPLSKATLFAADLGPGSFTGSKVAVTIAKSLGFANAVQVSGAMSFDLIDPSGPVVMPSKRGEWFVRIPGKETVRQTELPEFEYSGYGPGVSEETFPLAERFALILDQLRPVSPAELVPSYLIEPSISMPKSPLSPIQVPGA